MILAPLTPTFDLDPAFLDAFRSGTLTETPGKHRKQSPGAKPGHTGHCRPAPERIDRVVVHELPPCPCCGGVPASEMGSVTEMYPLSLDGTLL